MLCIAERWLVPGTEYAVARKEVNGEVSKEDGRAAVAALLSEDAEGMLSSNPPALDGCMASARHDSCWGVSLPYRLDVHAACPSVQGIKWTQHHSFRVAVQASPQLSRVHHLSVHLRPTESSVACAGDNRLPKRYIPFAEGPRNCVGQSLAKVSLVATMALLLARFSFRLADDVSLLPPDSMFAAQNLGIHPSCDICLA